MKIHRCTVEHYKYSNFDITYNLDCNCDFCLMVKEC